MSFQQSSPMAEERKSKFTYKNLTQLKSEKVDCPLRVIAHIDLDAFYAQCEMVRLGVAEDQPLAVQQWQNLIAVNYPARPFGIGRHINAAEARKLCPNIRLVHVATWKVGSESTHWEYRDDESVDFDIATEKVSLDYYRRQSKRILAIFRECCPRLEKASIDESFMDLSTMVYDRLIERYASELGVVDGTPIAPYGDPSEKLRLPEVGDLDWGDSFLIDLDDGETEEDHLDWDDVAMSIGAEIVDEIRKKVKADLGYTCSAGIAKNKALSKLGSGYKKPAQQSVVRNRAIQQFLAPMDFTKIRNLGGKFGKEIADTFATERIADLLNIPLETMKNKFGEEHGTWLYHIIRGIDKSEINVRTVIKSMLSAKSFRPVITKREQGEAWLKIFVADIVSRINEETIDTESPGEADPISIRRPSTMTLHHKYKNITKSRGAQIPKGKPISEDFMFPIAVNLLKHIEAEGQCWPCINLSLSVSGFDDVGRGNNKGIGTWLVRGEEAKVMNQESTKRPYPEESPAQDERRQRIGGIDRFLGARNDENNNIFAAKRYSNNRSPSKQEHEDSFDAQDDMEGGYEPAAEPPEKKQKSGSRSQFGSDTLSISSTRRRFFTPEVPVEKTTITPAPAPAQAPTSVAPSPTPDPSIEGFPCHRCDNKSIPIDEIEEHSDWHFARDLAEAENTAVRQVRAVSENRVVKEAPKAPALKEKEKEKAPPAAPVAKRGRGRPPKSAVAGPAGGPAKLEKGQKTLQFGK